jgi:hypothetical protein
MPKMSGKNAFSLLSDIDLSDSEDSEDSENSDFGDFKSSNTLTTLITTTASNTQIIPNNQILDESFTLVSKKKSTPKAKAPIIDKIIVPKAPKTYVDLTIANKKRCFTCCLCNSKQHGTRACIKFDNFRKNITNETYFANELHPSDIDGFCSAGIIPYCIDPCGEKFVLMLVETRQNKIGLNFIAGGREGLNDPLTKTTYIEPPYVTAINEFKEELGEILEPKSYESIKSAVINTEPSFVFWSSNPAKMALFAVKVSYDLCNKLVLVDNISTKKTEAQDFRWIKVSEYEKYNQSKNLFKAQTNDLYYHDFVTKIVKSIFETIRKK